MKFYTAAQEGIMLIVAVILRTEGAHGRLLE